MQAGTHTHTHTCTYTAHTRTRIRTPRVMASADRRRTAVHEAGHAVVSWFTTNADPPVKASIVWRGDALGFVQPKMLERTSKTREVYEDEMKVLLAGR